MKHKKLAAGTAGQATSTFTAVTTDDAVNERRENSVLQKDGTAEWDLGDTNNGITETIVLQESEPEPGTDALTEVTKTFGQQDLYSEKDWDLAGIVDEDLATTGLLDGHTNSHQDHCEWLQEVLKTERILRENEDDLPTFLNLTFEELCYQAAEDRRVMVLAVVQSANGSNTTHIARLLSGISHSNEIYFWLAEAGSSSGMQIKKKFGEQTKGSGLFILTPTKAIGSPILVDRFCGDSLKDTSLVDVTESLERGKSTLVTFGLECSALEEDRKLKRKQDEAFKEGLKEDRFKKIMQARKQRVIQEPEDDCWRIKVKCEDGASRARKFLKKAVYQEVYDWIGVEVNEINFTLHRPGAGFVGAICHHNERLREDETLLFIVRSASEAEEMLCSEVSFLGNYEGDHTEDLATTVQDGDSQEEQTEEKVKEKQEISVEREEESKDTGREKEKKKRKRRKKKKQEVSEGACVEQNGEEKQDMAKEDKKS